MNRRHCEDKEREDTIKRQRNLGYSREREKQYKVIRKKSGSMDFLVFAAMVWGREITFAFLFYFFSAVCREGSLSSQIKDAIKKDEGEGGNGWLTTELWGEEKNHRMIQALSINVTVAVPHPDP